MNRYFRGITVATPDARYRTLTDVVLIGPADTQPDLYHGARRRAEEKFGLRSDGYATTWFDLSPDVLVLDESPLPIFWTLSLGCRVRSRNDQFSSYGDALALPLDTRSGLLELVRQMAVKGHGVPADHGVLSFSCGPAQLTPPHFRSEI